MAMIELLTQRIDARINCLVLNNRTSGLFFSKGETRPVIVPVDGGGRDKKTFILCWRQAWRDRLPGGGKLKPVVCFGCAIDIKRRARLSILDQMARHEF